MNEVSFEYSHHKISSFQSKFTTDSLIFPKRGRFRHWREMRLTIHCSLFHVFSNWFKRLASFCANQSNHRRRVSLATNKKHIQNCKLLKICRACSRNHHMRNSRELKQQWRQQLRRRHLKNEFTLLQTQFSIPPRSIRQVLSNLSGVEIIKNVLKYRKRKRK